MSRPLKASFRSWLAGEYSRQDSALGDFARETGSDPCWPRSNNEHVLRAHLRAHDSCTRVYELFDEAYGLYLSLGLRPATGQTDEQAMKARMRTVLMRPDHSDRLRNYASKGSEVRALLPDSTDLSGSRSLREIADDWSRPGSVRPGSVYFIQSGNSGPVKIGFAADPESRMRGLQTGHPEKLRILAVLRNVSQRMEKNLHSRFGHLRMHGEWFRPESDLMTYIGELKAAPAVCCGSPKTCDHVWCPACHGWARDTGGFLGDGHETAYWSCGHVQPLHSRSLPPSEVTEACRTGACDHPGRAFLGTSSSEFYRGTS